MLLSIVIRVDPEKPNADEVAVDANGEESGISDCSIDGTFSEQAGFVSVSSCVKLVLNLISEGKTLPINLQKFVSKSYILLQVLM